MTQQALTACPNCLDFGIIPLGSSKTMQVVISNPTPQQGMGSKTASQTMLWQANTDAPRWLTIEGKDKTGFLLPNENKVVDVKVDTSSLGPGSQSAKLTFIAESDATSESIEVPVTVDVSPLAAGLSIAICTNSSMTLPLAITNLTGKAFDWQAATDIVGTNWLDLDRHNGTLQPNTVETVYVTAKSLHLQAPKDLPVANLTFTDAESGNKLAILPVQLHVSNYYTDNGPKITVDKAYLYFDFVNDPKLKGTNAGDKFLTITSPTVNGPVNWSVTSEVDWLTVVKSSGTLNTPTTPDNVTVKVTVDRSTLTKAEGEHRTDLLVTLTFTDPKKANYEPTTRFVLVKPFLP